MLSKSLLGIFPCAAICIVLFLLPEKARAFERHHYEKYPDLEGKIVERVLFLGNNKTQEIIFQREMRTMPGRPFNSADLWHDWERFTDLGLFAEVEVDAVASGEGVLVVVSVHERPSWFAAPVLDYDIGENQVTAGFQARLLNVRGLNQQFRSRFVTGERHVGTLSWSNPWVGSSSQSLAMDVRVDMPGTSEDELRSYSGGVSTTRFVGDYKRVRQGFTASTRIERLIRDANAIGGGIDQLVPSVGLSWSRDTRNVRIDPDRGTFFVMGSDYNVGVYSDTQDLNYIRNNLDGRAFLPLSSRFLFAVRSQTIFTTGKVPSYRLITTGGGSSIRGLESGILVGESFTRASGELRMRLLKSKRMSFQIPFVPHKMGKISNIDFRVDGVLFSDVGKAWFDPSDFSRAPTKGGYGFGFRLFVPFFELLRMELAFDAEGNPTFYLREGNII
ncbi:MAG TPA: BamA/TamA family outer membrane protein [bacterium]|nr:BamA/TamA family outer membrane protein [bacterium]